MGWLDDYVYRPIKTVLDPMDLSGVGPKPYGGLDESSGGAGESNVPAPKPGNFLLPGFDQRQLELNSAAFRDENRKAPQAQSFTSGISQAQDSQFRGNQQDMINRLSGLASGQDSLAKMQLQQATNANAAQQRSLAASANPQNAAMMARLASQNINKANQGFGAAATSLGIQERNSAANALAALSSQARAQDLQNSQYNATNRQQGGQFNAGQQQQGSQFNVGANLQQTGLNDRAAGEARQQELQNAELQQRGTMGYEQNNTTRYGIDKGVPAAPTTMDRLAGLAPLLSLPSDERTKTGIRIPGDGDLDQLIARLQPHSFGYKNDRNPMTGTPDAGRRLGVMAQDVERGGPAGSDMVQDVGGVKAIDVPKATGTALGLIGRLGQRLDDIEGRVAGKNPNATARTKTTVKASPYVSDTPQPRADLVDTTKRLPSIRDQYDISQDGRTWTPKPLGPPAPIEGPPAPGEGDVVSWLKRLLSGQ